MGSLAISTLSPCSPQLQLGLTSKQCCFHSLSIRYPKKALRYPRQTLFRIYASIENQGSIEDVNKKEIACPEASWENIDASSDSFSGWACPNSDNSDYLGKIKGFIGAGLACVFLAAGFAFALLQQKNASRPTLQLKPLAEQEKVSSDDLSRKVNKLKDKHEGTNASSPPTIMMKDAIFESVDKVLDGTQPDCGEINFGMVEPNLSSTREELQYNIGVSNASESIDVSPTLHNTPESVEVNPFGRCIASAFDAAGSFVKPDSGISNASEFVNLSSTLYSTSETGEADSFSPCISPCFDSTNSFVKPENGTDGLDFLSIPTTPEVIETCCEEDESKILEVEMPHDTKLSSDHVALCPDISLASGCLVLPDSENDTDSNSNFACLDEVPASGLNMQVFDLNNPLQPTVEGGGLIEEEHKEHNFFDQASLTSMLDNVVCKKEPIACSGADTGRSTSCFESVKSKNSFSHAGIPAPSLVSAAVQVHPGKILVPAYFDQFQGHALAALKVLKVVEVNVQAGDLSTRREYARWLVSASNILSRSPKSKVHPAMYIQNITKLAFDDITPEDPDYPSIQGLAEAGLISSKFYCHKSSNDDQSPTHFFPESPVSRQDLVSWKMALEKRQLPEADKKMLYESSGFLDIDEIHPDVWPALTADMSAGELGIVSLAFGYIKLFQPAKPVTKAQAAIALTTGEFADTVSEEIARIETEAMAESAVAAHNAMVAEVKKDVNERFEKEIFKEREKVDALQKMADELRLELISLKTEREEESLCLVRGKAALEAEMEVLSRVRRDVDEQLEAVLRNKIEILFEKDRIDKVMKETESEHQFIMQLHHDLNIEKKALSMARTWAENEARRAREQAKALEEARSRWESQGLKVIVAEDLQEAADAGVTWLQSGRQILAESVVKDNIVIAHAVGVVEKLRIMAAMLKLRSSILIDKIVEKIKRIIAILKERTVDVVAMAKELEAVTIANGAYLSKELGRSAAVFKTKVMDGMEKITTDCKYVVQKANGKLKP